jgi:hypothetical protein
MRLTYSVLYCPIEEPSIADNRLKAAINTFESKHG